MLRHRLITVLTFNNGTLFRTKLFEPDYRYTHEFVDTWSVDEMVVLDITREKTDESRQAFLEVVSQFARKCFVPMAVGGGIESFEDVQTYMAAGADKVVVNSAALKDTALITQIAQAYGAQCVVVSMDVRLQDSGDYEVYGRYASEASGKTPDQWARECETAGAGEIMVTSVERDGSLSGYDLTLCQQVSAAVRLPVLILGGAGAWQHFVEGIKVGGASAVCTQNIYHFTEASIASAKAYMDRADILVRLEEGKAS